MIAYLDEHKDAKKTAHWVEKAGRRAVLMAGDVAEQTHCRALVERALREFGRLDILVNNAAMQRTHKELSEITAEEWDRTFRTNIYSQFYLCQAAVPRMKPGSTIVNTTSINAKTPSPQLLAYAATKGAIANFTVCLAQMLERARDCCWRHGRLLYEGPTEAAERLPEIISCWKSSILHDRPHRHRAAARGQRRRREHGLGRAVPPNAASPSASGRR